VRRRASISRAVEVSSNGTCGAASSGTRGELRPSISLCQGCRTPRAGTDAARAKSRLERARPVGVAVRRELGEVLLRERLQLLDAGRARQLLAGGRERLVDDEPLVRRQMRAQPHPLLLAVVRVRPRRADGRLQLPDRLHAGALDPQRLGLADGDRQHRLRRTDPDAPGPQRVPEQRTRAQPSAEPGEVLGGALPEVEDLAGVVVEVIAQLREPVPLPERVESLADLEIQCASGSRRPGEEMLACVRLGLPTAEPRLEFGPGERRQLERRRRVVG
jgi:hypothetical protein